MMTHWRPARKQIITNELKMEKPSSGIHENRVRQSWRMHIKAEGLLDQSITPDAEPISGERLLVIRVIHQAIVDAIVKRPNPAPGMPISANMKNRRTKWMLERCQARSWLLDEDVDPHGRIPFTLEWCCMELGIPASTVRLRARRTFGLLDDLSVKPYTFTSTYYGQNGAVACLA